MFDSSLAKGREPLEFQLGKGKVIKGNLPPAPGGGGGVLSKKLGRGVRPTSQNPYPIYDQNLRFSLPYL